MLASQQPLNISSCLDASKEKRHRKNVKYNFLRTWNCCPIMKYHKLLISVINHLVRDAPHLHSDCGRHVLDPARSPKHAHGQRTAKAQEASNDASGCDAVTISGHANHSGHSFTASPSASQVHFPISANSCQYLRAEREGKHGEFEAWCCLAEAAMWLPPRRPSRKADLSWYFLASTEVVGRWL